MTQAQMSGTQSKALGTIDAGKRENLGGSSSHLPQNKKGQQLLGKLASKLNPELHPLHA
jgi:hypothetical protein